MSSGAKVVTAYCRETKAGVTPDKPEWHLLRRTSFGVVPTQNMTDNDEIGGSRMAQGRSTGTTDVGGDIGAKFRFGQHDAFLASCFGADWNNNKLTMGNDRIAFSLAYSATDIGVHAIARGCQVATWAMEVPNDGDITATVTMAGLGWEDKQGDTGFFSGETDIDGKQRYTFKQVTNISLNGVSGGDGFCVDSMNLQFDNAMQTQRCIGSGNSFAGANIPTTFTPSGSITLSWSPDAYRAWKKSLTGETMPFSFTVENDEGAYTFDLPSVQVDGDWPDAGNTDIVQVQLNITGSDTPPTITRKPAPVSVTGVTVAPTTSSVKVGATTTVTATIQPANATNQAVTWGSSDNSVTTVSGTDLKATIKGVKAGSANITATTKDGNKVATHKVTVTA